MAENKTEEPKVVAMADHIKQTGAYASIDEMLATGITNVEYREINGWNGPEGKKIRIGSVSAGDMIQWNETNEADKDAKRMAGLRLICKSLVSPAPDNIRFACLTEADLQGNMFKLKSVRHKETEMIIKEILLLNGMTVKKDAEEKKD